MATSPAIEAGRELSSPPSRSRAISSLASDVDVTALFGGDAATQLYVTTGGVLKYKLSGDSTWVEKTVGDKTYHTGRFVSIASSSNGTTASGLIADSF